MTKLKMKTNTNNVKGSKKFSALKRAAARACEITREAVKSDCFTEIGYNLEHQTLEVVFQPGKKRKRGATWRIYQITPQRFSAFRRAESLGGYFNRIIRKLANYEADCVAAAV